MHGPTDVTKAWLRDVADVQVRPDVTKAQLCDEPGSADVMKALASGERLCDGRGPAGLQLLSRSQPFHACTQTLARGELGSLCRLRCTR